MSDQAEIITRPPSHPLATSLLAASMLGTIGAIAIVWMELFGEYMPTYPQGQAPPPVPGLDQKWYQDHDPVTLAKKEQPTHDHYKIDWSDPPGPAEMLASVERDLGVGSKIGDPSAGPSDPVGEAPPVEAPPGEAPPGEAPPPSEGGEAPPPAQPPPEEGGGGD